MLVFATPSCAANSKDNLPAPEDPSPREVTDLFACDQMYQWRDQSYAFAKMDAHMCITHESSVRARAFPTAEAAIVALDDENPLLPLDAEVAIGEKMYVAGSGRDLEKVINAYPHLKRISRDELGTSEGTARDERDVCVGMIAAHFDSALHGDEGDPATLQGYEDVYPEASRAAARSAKPIGTDMLARQRLTQLRSDDPFAYDVWLSERVSPLKPLCA